MASSRKHSTVQTRVASLSDIESILDVTNDAFMADSFFKKKEYHIRFTRDSAVDMMHEENSIFLIAESGDLSPLKDVQSVQVVGSLHLHWELDIAHQKIIGKFSAVSVPTKFGKHGIGKALVNAAERYILDLASQQNINSADMEMGVINLRSDLFPWYKSQGYEVIGEIIPNSDELKRIILDDMNVCCVLMRKALDTNRTIITVI